MACSQNTKKTNLLRTLFSQFFLKMERLIIMSTLCLRKVAHDSCGPRGHRSIPAGALLPQRVVRSDLYTESTKATYKK